MVGWHHRLDGRFSKLRDLAVDREAWRSAVHGSQSRTRLSDRTECLVINPSTVYS